MKDILNNIYTFIIVSLSCLSFTAAGVMIVMSTIDTQQVYLWQAVAFIAIGIVMALFFLHLSEVANRKEPKDNENR
ncbi:hypothetical protein [Gracilimonas tropica]|uniref:hypothetical protein n=1 Tax=Gracilimonas tropica TaxID=454600 RepID=UPI0012F9A55E|nr:hypothetical protein [Gracilimonas tropica]